MKSFGPIQVIAPGLLGFLQLKSRGENPGELSDTYGPSIEMRDWLFQARALDWTQERGGGSPPGIGIGPGPATLGFNAFSPADLQVPASEMWWVEEFTISSGGLIATDTAMIAPAYQRPLTGTSNLYQLGPSSNAITGSATGKRVTVQARDFFLPPGSRLGILVLQNDTATSIVYSGYCRFTPLPL